MQEGLWETRGPVPAQGISELPSRNEWELARERGGVGEFQAQRMKAGEKVTVMCVGE